MAFTPEWLARLPPSIRTEIVAQAAEAAGTRTPDPSEVDAPSAVAPVALVRSTLTQPDAIAASMHQDRCSDQSGPPEPTTASDSVPLGAADCAGGQQDSNCGAEAKSRFVQLGPLDPHSDVEFIPLSAAEALLDRGLAIVDGFLGSATAQAARDAAGAMHQEGVLRPARMQAKGRTSELATPAGTKGARIADPATGPPLESVSEPDQRWEKAALRGDTICWLSSPRAAAQVPDALRKVIQALHGVQQDLSAAIRLPFSSVQVQLACYAGRGAGYVRHVDAPGAPVPQQPKRLVTALYYLNTDWKPCHGGLLRIYNVGSAQQLPGQNYEDVAPLGDRLVLFMSDRFPHEVLAAHSDRFALTAWFYGVPPPTDCVAAPCPLG